jgi:TatD DNase family protein
VFHAYSGSKETFRELDRLGDWYIGLGGVLTYKKASIAETAREIPLDRILLETDSPYLTPVPFRGKRNESSYIPYIAQKLSEITGKDIAEIAEKTTENAQKLFKI